MHGEKNQGRSGLHEAGWLDGFEPGIPALRFDLGLPMKWAVVANGLQGVGRISDMSQGNIAVPVDHKPVVHEIETTSNEEPLPVTLLELVKAVSEVSDNEREVIATVVYMLSTGRVRLSGSFRDASLTQLCG